MEEMFNALRGQQPAKLVALLKIRDYTCENTDTVRWVTCGQMLTIVNSRHLSDQHGLVTVQMRENA